MAVMIRFLPMTRDMSRAGKPQPYIAESWSLWDSVWWSYPSTTPLYYHISMCNRILPYTLIRGHIRIYGLILLSRLINLIGFAHRISRFTPFDASPQNTMFHQQSASKEVYQNSIARHWHPWEWSNYAGSDIETWTHNCSTLTGGRDWWCQWSWRWPRRSRRSW